MKKNILTERLKIISSGTGDYTGGDSNKTSEKKHKAVKPEAQSIRSEVGGQFTCNNNHLKTTNYGLRM